MDDVVNEIQRIGVENTAKISGPPKSNEDTSHIGRDLHWVIPCRDGRVEVDCCQLLTYEAIGNRMALVNHNSVIEIPMSKGFRLSDWLFRRAPLFR